MLTRSPNEIFLWCQTKTHFKVTKQCNKSISNISELWLHTKFVLRGGICNSCNVNSRDRFRNSFLRFLLRKNTFDICQGFWTGCCPMCNKWFSPTVKKQNVKDVIFVISPTYSAASSSSSTSSSASTSSSSSTCGSSSSGKPKSRCYFQLQSKLVPFLYREHPEIPWVKISSIWSFQTLILSPMWLEAVWNMYSI